MIKLMCRIILGCLIVNLFSSALLAGPVLRPLPAAEAFVFSAAVPSDKSVRIEWAIAPGYFLYATRLHFSSPGAEIQPALPTALIMNGLDGKPEALYNNHLSVPLTFKTNMNTAYLIVDYQGCSREGFCYPPMQKRLTINWDNRSIAYQTNSPPASSNSWVHSALTDQNKIQHMLATENVIWTLLIFFFLGMLLAFTPCVLPMVPILTSIIVGQKHRGHRSKSFFLSLVYVFGMAVTYAFAGVFAALLGSSIQVLLQKPVFIGIVSVIFILLALSMFEFYDLPISRRWHNKVMAWSHRHESGTYLGVFFMGVLSTLIVSPCVTAPLLGVLIYIGQSGNIVLGASTLFIMALGMGVPLLIVAVSADKWLPKSGPWMKAIVKTFGMLMFGIAIWLLSRVISHAAVLFLWGAFCAGIALFVIYYLPKWLGKKFTMALAGIAAMMLVIGFVAVKLNWQLTSSLYSSDNAGVASQNNFIVVRNLQAFDQQLKAASNAGVPVLLDFYADWCESCVAMEKVLASPRVKKVLENFVLLRIDLSANSAEDQALLKHFKVIAPPTILFFNAAGHELESRRIVGEMSEDEFLNKLNLFFAGRCDKQITC